MISKKQTFEILSMISELYDQFEITQNRIDAWHLALKNSDFEVIENNLFEYAKANRFPPKIADLHQIKSENAIDRMNAIPNADETRTYLQSMELPKETKEEKVLIEESKAKIRKILGIG